MEKKEYTVRQIAEIGIKKFKIEINEPYLETRIDTLRKRIEKIIKEKDIESTGMAKSTITAKRPAKTYSK